MTEGQILLEVAARLLPEYDAGTHRDLARSLSNALTEYRDWLELAVSTTAASVTPN